MVDFLKSILKDSGDIMTSSRFSRVEFKTSLSDPVTDTDRRIEEFLFEKLSKEFPDFALIGEESFDGSLSNDKKIYVDPIDGTVNFINNIPFACTSIGVYCGGLISGGVYNPFLNEMFLFDERAGSTFNDAPMALSDKNSIKGYLYATGFPYDYHNIDMDKHLRYISRAVKNQGGIRRLGSAALDICYLANGRFDCYFEEGIKSWDVAGALAILKGVGGDFSDDRGANFHLDKDKYLVAFNPRMKSELFSEIFY